MKEKIQQIRKKYLQLAKKLNAQEKHLHFYETPQHDGSPHIEYEGNEFVYVHTERGSRYNERRTTDQGELLRWLITDLTRQMALAYELAHRIKGEDFRRQYFAKHLELLASINTDWAKLQDQEYNAVLKKHPYMDKGTDNG